MDAVERGRFGRVIISYRMGWPSDSALLSGITLGAIESPLESHTLAGQTPKRAQQTPAPICAPATRQAGHPSDAWRPATSRRGSVIDLPAAGAPLQRSPTSPLPVAERTAAEALSRQTAGDPPWLRIPGLQL
jgi:hypothetical protein